MFGARLEVELRKICTAPARESDLEAKIVKNWRSWEVFGGSKCFSRGRRRDFEALQNTWQAQEFVISCFVDVDVWGVGRWIRGRVASFMPRKCYSAGIISRGSYRSSYASAQLFRGRRSTFAAPALKSLKHIVILRSSVWSTCHFWRKSRRKASFLSFKVVEPLESEIILRPNQFKPKPHEFHIRSISNQVIIWPWNQMNLKSVAYQIHWISNPLNFKSFEFEFQIKYNFNPVESQINQINWISNHLKPKSWISCEPIGSHTEIIWTWNHLNLASLESQVTCLNLKPFESQISDWQSNHLSLEPIDNQPFESQINGQQNHLNLKTIESRIVWIILNL